MNISFHKHDNIYTIFSTLKKIPSYKEVFLTIEKGHVLYDHLRRGQYIKNIQQEYHLQLTCIAKDTFQQDYRHTVQIPTQKTYTTPRIQTLTSLSKIFGTIFHIHQRVLREKGLWYIPLLLSECVLILGLCVILWKYISPNTTIIITPAYHIESIVHNFRYYDPDIYKEPNTNTMLALEKGTIPFQESGSFSISQDIDTNKKKILKNIYAKKIHLVHAATDQKKQIALGFDDIINTIPGAYTPSPSTGKQSNFQEGKIEGTLQYYFISIGSLQKYINSYLTSRNSEYSKIYGIEPKGTVFYTKKSLGSGLYEIATKIDLIRGYDFQNDAYIILPEIRNKILGLPSDQARTILLQYEGIASVTFHNSPFRLRSIADTAERISFQIENIVLP